MGGKGRGGRYGWAADWAWQHSHAEGGPGRTLSAATSLWSAFRVACIRPEPEPAPVEADEGRLAAGVSHPLAGRGPPSGVGEGRPEGRARSWIPASRPSDLLYLAKESCNMHLNQTDSTESSTSERNVMEKRNSPS